MIIGESLRRCDVQAPKRAQPAVCGLQKSEPPDQEWFIAEPILKSDTNLGQAI
jgi:hypothetical protein